MNHNHEGMNGMDMPMDTNMNMNMNMNMDTNMDTNMKMNMNMDLDAHTGMHHDHSGMMTMSSSSSSPSSSSSSSTTTMEAMVDFASDTIASSGHETFCDAGMGMVMYMEGFHWTLAPPRNNNHNKNNNYHNNNNNNHNNNHGQRNCLNLYFESWTLDTRPKFFAAMVLVVVLGIVTEGLGRWKHEVAKQQQQLQQQQQQQQQSWQSQSRSRSERLYWTHTVLQGLSILSAYLLMLVVMTYSLELFSCVIAGLTIGYRVFGGETFRHGGGGGAGTLCCDFLRDEPQSPLQPSLQPSLQPPSQTQADSDSDSDAYTNRRVSLTERLLPRTVEPNGGTLVGATATAGTGYSYYGTNSNGHSCCSSNGSGSSSGSSSGDVEVEVVAGHDDE